MEQYLSNVLNRKIDDLPPINTTFHIPEELRNNDTVFLNLVNWEVHQQQTNLISSVGDCVVPLRVNGMGNCLLEAVSKAVWGTEIHAHQLGNLLKNEINNNFKYYRALVSQPEEFETHLKEAAEGGPLRFFHILALSNLLERPIFVYAPPELTLMHGIGHGGVSASFVPTRIGSWLCRTLPIALAFSSSPSLVYVPIVPFEGSRVRWPVLPPAFDSTLNAGETVQSYIEPNFPILYPPMQKLLGNPEAIAEYAQKRDHWGKQNPQKYISTVRELKAKYDLVWQIEMGGGEQRFICYNVGDNPYELARKFVTVERIPHQYEKILNFIFTQIENAKRDTNLNHIFTRNWKKPPISRHFPFMGDMLSYSTAKFPQIVKKIMEFNESLKEDPKTAPLALSLYETNKFNEMVTKLEQNSNILPEHYQILEKALNWPSSKIFPVLDIIRMVADNSHSVKYMQTNQSLVSKVLSIGKKEDCNATNMFLILKTVVNIQRKDAERILIRSFYSDISYVINAASHMNNSTVYNCLSTAMLNFSLLTTELTHSKHSWATILLRILLYGSDPEIVHRSLITLGSLLYKEQTLCEVIAPQEDFKSIIRKYGESKDEKIKQCVEDLQNLVHVM